jgi:hypothetical protein
MVFENRVLRRISRPKRDEVIIIIIIFIFRLSSSGCRPRGCGNGQSTILQWIQFS